MAVTLFSTAGGIGDDGTMVAVKASMKSTGFDVAAGSMSPLSFDQFGGLELVVTLLFFHVFHCECMSFHWEKTSQMSPRASHSLLYCVSSWGGGR